VEGDDVPNPINRWGELSYFRDDFKWKLPSEQSLTSSLIPVDDILGDGCSHPRVQCFLRTMCGSRTGGWLLPGVMSD
jgi:hypothetical protein